MYKSVAKLLATGWARVRLMLSSPLSYFAVFSNHFEVFCRPLRCLVEPISHYGVQDCSLHFVQLCQLGND